jgi:hypothetical protein
MGGGSGGEQGNAIVIPSQGLDSMNAASAPTDQQSVPTQQAEKPAAPASGTGPILGIPTPDEAGQILDRKAILGQPQAGVANNSRQGLPQPTSLARGGAEKPSSQAGSQAVLLTVIQVLLALVAVATGVGAYLIRRRRTAK